MNRTCAVLAVGVAALFTGCAADSPRSGSALVVGYVGSSDALHMDGWRGAQLGASEVQRAAQLIGRSMEVYAEDAADSAAVHAAALRLIDRGATVLVGGHDDASCRALDRIANARDVLFLNVGCRSDALRSGAGNTFHVQASDAQRRAPDGGPGMVRPESRVAWHGGLGRYGAAQLNRRFSDRFGGHPGESAWAAWMAMKIAWEATQQQQRSDVASLRAFLLSDRAGFDGHKGQTLSFDAATHQLLQPLYPAQADPTSPRETRIDARRIAVDGAEALRDAVAAGARLAVVTNEGTSDVSVIDGRTWDVIATISLVARPRGVRTSPDGRHAYIAMSDDAPTEESDADAIVVIDLGAGAVVGLHDAGSDPEQFDISPDGTRLYTANEDAGTATISDPARDTALATLVVGIEPEGVAASPDGRWVYVTAETSNTVSVIDTELLEVVANFLVDVRPRAAVFAPNSREAYVTNEISGTLSIVAVPDHRVVETIELAGGAARPVTVAVAPDGSRVYVANGHAGSVSVIDTATRTEVAVVDVGRRPWGVDVSRDGSLVVTANGLSDDMTVIDARTLEVIATVPVGGRPWGVALTH